MTKEIKRCGLRRRSVLSAAMAAPAIFYAPVAHARRVLTVRETINTSRLMNMGAARQDVDVSPDGRRYVARIIRGDVERDGVWFEIAAGSLDSVEQAARPRVVARLFTSALGHLPRYHYPLSPLTNPLAWVDERTIAFLWEDSEEILQVAAIDVETGAQRFLTQSATDVVNFSVGRDGAIFYAAQAPSNTAASPVDGDFYVTAGDALALLQGAVDLPSTLDQMYNFDAFTIANAGARAQRAGVRFRWGIAFSPQLSPDGRLALVNAWPAAPPEEWRAYVPDDAPILFHIIAQAFSEPDQWYGRQITQLHIVDIPTGAAHPLWNVPTLNPYSMKAAWSPDSHSVLIGPTLLPLEDQRAQARAGFALADIDAATGSHAIIPIPADALPDAPTENIGARLFEELHWISDRRIEVRTPRERLRFERDSAQWRLVERTISPAGEASQAAVRIDVRQDMNTPPALYAVEGASGRTRLALDLNPGLGRDLPLGRVEEVSWADADGEAWKGLLYRPVNYRRGRRYPMVIQTHGYMPAARFSLYGMGIGGAAPGTGPGYSIYAAQALANCGIAVLQMEDKRPPGVGSREPELHMRGYEGAIAHFDRLGLIDAARVGISGFSRTGWHVEYALTHSDFVFAAAITTDNISGSYLQATLTPGSQEIEVGAAPFGEGLERWLENSPGFSVERVHTPLRLQIESRGGAFLLAKWELFSRLRQLRRPVEFYVIPRISRGGHNIQNPRQVLAVQQGAVDWYDFWLNGREDSSPAKAEQYARWRMMRHQRDAVLRAPRPTLLDWAATPRAS